MRAQPQFSRRLAGDDVQPSPKTCSECRHESLNVWLLPTTVLSGSLYANIRSVSISPDAYAHERRCDLCGELRPLADRAG
jgi:hypothetical protein